jgi:hypothetical protein
VVFYEFQKNWPGEKVNMQTKYPNITDTKNSETQSKRKKVKSRILI